MQPYFSLTTLPLPSRVYFAQPGSSSSPLKAPLPDSLNSSVDDQVDKLMQDSLTRFAASSLSEKSLRAAVSEPITADTVAQEPQTTPPGSVPPSPREAASVSPSASFRSEERPQPDSRLTFTIPDHHRDDRTALEDLTEVMGALRKSIRDLQEDHKN